MKLSEIGKASSEVVEVKVVRGGQQVVLKLQCLTARDTEDIAKAFREESTAGLAGAVLERAQERNLERAMKRIYGTVAVALQRAGLDFEEQNLEKCVGLLMDSFAAPEVMEMFTAINKRVLDSAGVAEKVQDLSPLESQTAGKA